MLEIRARFDRRGEVPLYGRLRLPFDRRQKSRQRATLESGEEVAIVLARGEVMRGGDLVVAAEGQVIEVVAESESVMHVECTGTAELARIAYHLGNRHVPVQVGERWLRFTADAVLARMVEGLGGTVTTLDVAFEPEAGAYGPHHRHDLGAAPPGDRIDDSGHGGRIHEFKSRP
jgi:urease accessory protein